MNTNIYCKFGILKVFVRKLEKWFSKIKRFSLYGNETRVNIKDNSIKF